MFQCRRGADSLHGRPDDVRGVQDPSVDPGPRAAAGSLPAETSPENPQVPSSPSGIKRVNREGREGERNEGERGIGSG